MNSKILFSTSAACLFSATTLFAQGNSPWFLSSSDSLCGVRLTEACAVKGKNPPPRKKSEIIVAVIDGRFGYFAIRLLRISSGPIPANKPATAVMMTGTATLTTFTAGISSAMLRERLSRGPARSLSANTNGCVPSFKDADTARLTSAQKADYTYYKQMERAARLDTYITFAAYQRARADAFRICDSLMRWRYGDRETTVADFQKLELSDTTGLARALSIAASTPVMFLPDMPWRDAVQTIEDEYLLSAKRVASLDSLNDDPHLRLGNTPDDFRNLRYGNNRIDEDAYHGTMVARNNRRLRHERGRHAPSGENPFGPGYSRRR